MTSSMDTLADRLARQFTQDHGLVGGAVAIVTGESVSVGVSGMADIERNVPITPQSVFRIASITKTMTAIAVMQLVEQGLVNLDEPVNTYLRAYSVGSFNAVEPTVRDMLRHTSGIGEWAKWREALHPIRGLGPTRGGAIPTMKDLHAPVLKLQAQPSSRWGYSNHAFLALGQLVQDVSGQSLATFLTQRLFQPAGMNRSCGEPVTPEIEQHLAIGYVRDKGKQVAYEFRHEVRVLLC
jgi:CubicO group peptidase (beta-lactamase class C family)